MIEDQLAISRVKNSICVTILREGNCYVEAILVTECVVWAEMTFIDSGQDVHVLLEEEHLQFLVCVQ